MAGNNTAVFAIFSNRATAELALNQLTAAGFSNQDISVLMSDRRGAGSLATEKNTKAPEGTATGVTVGGAIGGALGLLAGIGALAIPGVGPLIAAGPLMAALAGLGIGGATGGLIGGLAGLGIPEYEARRFEGRIQNGGVLLSIHCDTSEQISTAKDLLRNAGGEDIASTSERTQQTQSVTATGNDLVGQSRTNTLNRQEIPVEEVDRVPTTIGSTSRHTY